RHLGDGMSPFTDYVRSMTRRHLFAAGAAGLGVAALASLLPTRRRSAPAAAVADDEETVEPPTRPPPTARDRRAIYLFMNGGTSQMDLWDYKPKMADLFDTDLPDSVRNGQRLNSMTGVQKRLPVAPSRYRFSQHGQCGTWVSELLPWTSKVVDDLAVVRS